MKDGGRTYLYGAIGLLAAAPLASRAAHGQFVESTRVIHEFLGENANDNFGWVSAPIPDLDEDGASEVVITAPFHDAVGSNSGRIYVYSGRTGAERFQFSGTSAGQQVGFAARAAGDVDRDGFADLIVGAPGSASVAGRAYVLSGDDGSIIWTIQQGAAGDSFGASVAGAGDVNDDGFIDLAIGATNDDTNGTNAGRVYIVSGADGATVLWTIEGEAANNNFGSALGAIGDVTNDGRDDLAVGANNGGAGNGRAYVYDLFNEELVYTLDPDGTAGSFGQFFIDSPGDATGDGVPDVYVADFSDSENGAGAGKAYVFNGADGTRHWVLPGRDAGDGFGIGRGCGDVNNDGFADLLLCGWVDDDGASNAGKGEVFSGEDGTVIRGFTSTTAGEGFGFDAHGIGDVDDDGRLDFFVTAAYNGTNGFRSGKCYLISGGLTLQPPAPGIAGVANDVVVNGGEPGASIQYGYGFKAGSTAVPGCPGLFADIRAPELAGVATADRFGNAVLTRTVPGSASGRSLRIQALERDACLISNVVEYLFP
ncbi:MAG: integrin alpha [Phycisphaerales bacterium]